MNRVERLTAILLLLQDKSRTSEEIARHFEMSKRTIIRDVQALSEMGVPVIAREGVGGGYSLPDDYRLPPLPLTSRGAAMVESEPNVAARVRRNDDGSGTFFSRCPPEEFNWFTRYFASLGDEVVVLEPPELRERMARLGEQLAKRYQNR